MRAWLLGLCAAALLGVVCSTAAGEDRPVLRLTTGLVLLLVLLSPVVDFNLSELSEIWAESRYLAENVAKNAEIESQAALMEGISAQTEAYILDKAQDMGLHLSVEVTVVMGERYPYPAAVALTGRSTTAQRQQINRWLREELAIAEEDVTWNE